MVKRMAAADHRSRWSGVSLLASVLVVSVLGAGCVTDLERRFQTHIDYLASDALEGRGVGTRGIDLAANYIAEQFAEIGLEPTAAGTSYFHRVPMTLGRSLTRAGQLAFDGDAKSLVQKRDFLPLSFSSGEGFDAQIVFCGYGIVAPEKDRDDFVHVDVTGRAVLMFGGFPPSWAKDEANIRRSAMLRTKVYNAKDRGATAVLIVNQRPEPGIEDVLMPFDGDSPDQYGIPAFQLTRSVIDAKLAGLGMDSLNQIQEKLDAGAYLSKTLDLRISGEAGFRNESISSFNVAGLLKGEGPLADEIVLIGAHYDHLGIRRPMMRKFKGGRLVREKMEPQIHNGADDNASGTSGLIEIARMLAAGPPPKRSILFIAFTGEEAGLHGSKHYVNEPLVPLKKTVAMLNMDMIGRMPRGGAKVQVFGADPGSDLGKIVSEAAKAIGIKIEPAVDSGGRSDHAPFVTHHVPSLHFYTGSHRDYHKPSDDANKINARGGAKVAMLVRDIAWNLATQAGRPKFQAPKKEASVPSGGTPTYRVVMGLTPSYINDDQPGMLVDAVSPEGPADQGGMKGGDRIIRIGGKTVANIYDYMAATRNNKAGDVVEVVVLRKGRERTLKVRLAPAG